MDECYCPLLIRITVGQQIFMEVTNVKFHKIRLSVLELLDGQAERAKLLGAFWKHLIENSPEKLKYYVILFLFIIL
jgi:hypothetical protein